MVGHFFRELSMVVISVRIEWILLQFVDPIIFYSFLQCTVHDSVYLVYNFKHILYNTDQYVFPSRYVSYSCLLYCFNRKKKSLQTVSMIYEQFLLTTCKKKGGGDAEILKRKILCFDFRCYRGACIILCYRLLFINTVIQYFFCNTWPWMMVAEAQITLWPSLRSNSKTCSPGTVTCHALQFI